MKKFYFLLVAMLVGFAANADYYLIGGFNGWTLKDAKCLFTDNGDGTFVLNYNGTLTSGFKINDGTWGDVDFGSNGSNLQIGVPYALTAKGGNIAIGENIENPVITFNPTEKTLLIEGAGVEAKTAYDLWGDWAGTGTWSNVTLTENEGIWEGSVTVSSSIGFGIRMLDAASGTQTSWISADGTSTIVATGKYACKIEGTNFTLSAGSWAMAFNPETMTLSATLEGGGTTPDPDPKPEVSYDLWGDWMATGAWSNVTLTNNEGIWEGKATTTSAISFGIRVLDTVGEQTDWISADGDGKITKTGEYACKIEGTNFTLSAGTWAMAFNPETMTLSATLESEETDYTTWYFNVVGNFNEWIDNGITFDENGYAVHEDLAIGTSEFKIKIWNGSATSWYSTGTAVAVGESIVIAGNSDINMTIEGAAEGDLFNVAFDVTTGTMVVSKADSGVEIVESENVAAEYFNLQGVKVAEPTEGLYIVRRGNTVTKELVR